MLNPTTVATGGATLLALLGILVLAQGMSERDLSRHIQRVVAGNDKLAAPRSARNIILSGLRTIGVAVQRWSVFSARDIAELERAARSAGFSPESTVPIVIGGKLVLMLSCPVVAYVAARHLASPWPLICTCVGVAVGMFGPNALINYARRSRMKALRLGLSDALDLLVVCAEAGLGLESAIDRVAATPSVEPRGCT